MNSKSTIASMVVLGLMTCAAIAGFSPPRGSVAPPITLKSLDGETVATTSLTGKALVLVFGELGHEGTRQACADVLDVIAEPRFVAESIVPLMIIASDVPVAQLKDESARGRFPALILHDPKRSAFDAYRVLAMPTIVIVDTKGKVIHSIPAYQHRSRDQFVDAVLTSIGRMPVADFERAIDPAAQAAISPDAVKSERLVHLGIELARHGMFDIAEARFKEALALVPGSPGATLGLGELMLRQDRLPEAQQYFRSLLAAAPDSLDATLGIAAVQVRKGGDALSEAEASLKTIIDKHPKNARARYLMGQVREQRGDIPGAMADYKAASKLLLEP